MNPNNEISDGQPSTLLPSGSPPETRIGDAQQAKGIYQRLWRADLQYRAPKRATLNGLRDGNPPFRQADLDNAGMSHRCNINFRVSESYLNNAVGAFYDLFNEAPTYATIRLKKGSSEQIASWSRSVTLHFDWLCRGEPRFDYDAQRSQDEMVWHGKGPFVFQDIFDWRPSAILERQLLVPDMTLSDTSYWGNVAIIIMEYQVDELWQYIRNEREATMLGWNVERAKQAIINASPESSKGGMWNRWEYHQQMLKNGSAYYAGSSKTVSVSHVFCREFAKEGEAQGKITHVMVVRDETDGSPDKFLFQKIGRFENWNQCIHPMYYDRGGGGYHHSVTGMGTKMYSLMELQNRLYCSQADRAMLPKLMLKPTTSTAAEGMSLTQNGDHLILTEGMDVIQTPLAGLTEEEMLFNRELTNLVSSNLSQYRTNATEPMKGNPETATGRRLDASQEAALQKTQMNRFYNQEDGLYSEMYRRAVNTTSKSSPGGERAMEFIKRCVADGVPKEVLKDVEWVKASRVVGQGSAFMRQEALTRTWVTLGPGLPEDGKQNLMDAMIATDCGPDSVDLFNPKANASTLPNDQYALAISQVADMKIGVPAVVTSTQNPAIFASTFMKAADDAAGTLEQGANPQEVLSFLEMCGQAIAKHMQRMAQDPSRKALVKELSDKLKQLSKSTDALQQHLQQQAQQQQQKQQAVAKETVSINYKDAPPDIQRQMEQAAGFQPSTDKNAQVDSKLLKAQQGMQIKGAQFQQKQAQSFESHRQDLILNDARTAQQIKLDAAKHVHGTALERAQAAHDMKMAVLEQEHQQRMDSMSAKNGAK